MCMLCEEYRVKHQTINVNAAPLNTHNNDERILKTIEIEHGITPRSENILTNHYTNDLI